MSFPRPGGKGSPEVGVGIGRICDGRLKELGNGGNWCFACLFMFGDSVIDLVDWLFVYLFVY